MGKGNSSAISIFRFPMTLKNRFEFCFLFFIFALTLKNGFALRISFFVFGSLEKMDINFSFRFSFSLQEALKMYAKLLRGAKMEMFTTE